MAISIANLTKQSYMFLSATHCLMDKGNGAKKGKALLLLLIDCTTRPR